MGVTDGASMMDPGTGETLLRWGHNVAFGEPGLLLHANRALLREFLVPRAAVQWGKRLERYAEDASGVTAFFTDGTSARGTALVGADGSSSPVRKQLLAASLPALVRLPYGVLVAEYELSREATAAMRKDASAFQVATRNGVLVFVGLREPAGSETAVYYYHLYWPDEAAATDPAGYWTQHASPEQLRAKVGELTAGWRGSIKELLDRSRPEHMMVPPFMLRQFMPPDHFPRGRVTLLGDAAHTMTPFRGMGANGALHDAMDLARLIGDGRALEIPQLFKRFEAAMIPRGQDLVQRSGRALGDDPTSEFALRALRERYGANAK